MQNDFLHRECKIMDVDPNEGTMTWMCNSGHRADQAYESLDDVIHAADVHLEYQCIR